MDLYIIRHAWAGDYGDPQWPDDSLRPLSKEGKRRFAGFVDALASRGFAPELIATSPLIRCVETAQLVARGVEGEPDVIQRNELLPESDLQGLLAWTEAQSRKYRHIAWVGHAPDVGQLTAALVGNGQSWIRFSKGAIAAIRFPGLPRPAEAELRWLVTAKVLGC
ncbi:MAG TPA: histidine phosphatase family protein [Thermoguttaceae bacterium]|nr:histidine phosphatase family protein [Thermoguttaceae bacterium]